MLQEKSRSCIGSFFEKLKNDQYMGYLSVNADGKLVFTSILRAGDNEVLGYYTGPAGLDWDDFISLRNYMEMSEVMPDKFKAAINKMIGTSVTFTGIP